MKPMNEMQKVNISLCKCKEGQRPFGVRFEQNEKNWIATWAFPIKKDGAESREQYDKTVLKGQIGWGADYPGCPYCGGRGFVICDRCGGLNCNMNASHEQFTCAWCGLTGTITEYSGDGFNASGDR